MHDYLGNHVGPEPEKIIRPIAHYHSPSTGETMTVWPDDVPSIEYQVNWIGSHPDAVKLETKEDTNG